MDEDLRARYRLNKPYNRREEPPSHRPPRPAPTDLRQPKRPVAAPQPHTPHNSHQPTAQPPQARQYYPEPAPVHDSPSHHAAARHHKTAGKLKNKRRLVLIIASLLIAAGAGGAYWYLKIRQVSPIPASTRDSVSFPLPYPSKLPAGYHLDSSSYSSSRSVVIYSAVGQSAAKIIFTAQKRPPNFDFTAFYKNGLTNSTVFAAPAGQAAIGGSEGHLLGSLVTDNSWLLVNSSSNDLQASDLRLILNGVKISPR